MESVKSSLLQPENQTRTVEDVPFHRRKRYLVTAMVFMGMCALNMLRASLPIAIVDMTTAKNITDGDSVYVKKAEFSWTTFENGLILGSRQCFCVFGFVGGLLGCKHGGVLAFGLSVAANGALTMICPQTLQFGTPPFLVGRILDGAAYAFAVSTWPQVFIRWAPFHERARMVGAGLSGFFVGAILAFPVCGVILEKLGWPWVFYLTGGFTLVWYIIWAVFIYDNPLEDKFISNHEKYYITEKVDIPSIKKNLPWKRILTSKAVWALFNERFVEAWTLSFAFECLPFYVKNSIGVSISEVGFISSVPQICNFLGIMFGGHLSDTIRNRKTWSPHQVHRFFIIFGEISCAILYIITGFCTNFVGSIFCMCLLRFIYGCFGSCYVVLEIDMAGEYAGLVHGLATSIMVVGYVVNPLLMSWMVKNHNSSGWSRYFMLLSILNIWAAVIFSFFGSGKPESWSTVEEESTHVELEDIKKNCENNKNT